MRDLPKLRSRPASGEPVLPTTLNAAIAALTAIAIAGLAVTWALA